MIKHIESSIAGKGLSPNYVSQINELGTRLHLKGSIFTQNDGSLKVTAEGEEANLVEFAKKLQKGSFFSSVENFYVRWDNAREAVSSFNIETN